MRTSNKPAILNEAWTPNAQVSYHEIFRDRKLEKAARVFDLASSPRTEAKQHVPAWVDQARENPPMNLFKSIALTSAFALSLRLHPDSHHGRITDPDDRSDGNPRDGDAGRNGAGRRLTALSFTRRCTRLDSQEKI